MSKVNRDTIAINKSPIQSVSSQDNQMKQKEIIIQIFTGGYKKSNVTFEEIEKKLRPLLESISISKVIMGWAINEQLYNRTKELIQPYGVELYIWLPVFSETALLKETSELVDYENKSVKQFQLKEDENFEFYCPNQQSNLDAFFKIYEEHFSSIPFDGVFLDKIRFPSFANGLNGVFNCFCSECLKRYREMGISVDILKAEMAKISHGSAEYAQIPFRINHYSKGVYVFDHHIWNDFFQYKAHSVAVGIKKIADYMHRRHRKVGLDTFAPFISCFVGQDMEQLAELADFIKPMMYRLTNAPAGLSFEYNRMLAEALITDRKMESKPNQCFNATSYESIWNMNATSQSTFDLSFVLQELEYMSSLQIPIYAGIEVNRIQNVAPVTPEYIKENLEGMFQSDIMGFTLSWDILSAPQENIEAVIQYCKAK